MIGLQVDSGADLTVISLSAARKAGLRVDRNSPVIIISGVAGEQWAVLAKATIRVGDAKEESVTIAIAPGLDLGKSDGLLGLSFLERFKTTIGGKEVKLAPIDEGEKPRYGGHGKSWWSLRFQKVKDRMDLYSSALPAAKQFDKNTASEIGVDPEEFKLEDLVNRLKAFTADEVDALSNEAGRFGVPREWRE
ncbi:MAG: retropepsin-like domain-containing protein [Deltaproteobacteria bacterium]|nr:retropepsin-like domain-containing protein [Deltaproteobacteria bacterium]